ncbi:MAG: peroxide stress protein YaaA [Bacteroidales bacterium]|nr:peroxide stress protein YaaA [Bacteroidales bacterium]
MITIISPAKNLNFNAQNVTDKYTIPVFLEESEKIIKRLKTLSPKNIAALMNVSSKIADLNYSRFQQWQPDLTLPEAKQAVLAFNGEVYNGLKAYTLTAADLDFAQDHLRILSGLHGILRPLDLIRPYRLEMSTKIKIGRKNNLYEFWDKKIHKHLFNLLASHKEKIIINLASNEYAKAALLNNFKQRVITPVFKELKDDQYNVITIYAKKARGLLTRYILKNRINDPQQLKMFEEEGYFYQENLSTKNEWVFTR